MDSSARYVIKRMINPRFLSSLASYDVARTINESLPRARAGSRRTARNPCCSGASLNCKRNLKAVPRIWFQALKASTANPGSTQGQPRSASTPPYLAVFLRLLDGPIHVVNNPARGPNERQLLRRVAGPNTPIAVYRLGEMPIQSCGQSVSAARGKAGARLNAHTELRAKRQRSGSDIPKWAYCTLFFQLNLSCFLVATPRPLKVPHGHTDAEGELNGEQ